MVLINPDVPLCHTMVTTRQTQHNSNEHQQCVCIYCEWDWNSKIQHPSTSNLHYQTHTAFWYITCYCSTKSTRLNPFASFKSWFLFFCDPFFLSCLLCPFFYNPCFLSSLLLPFFLHTFLFSRIAHCIDWILSQIERNSELCHRCIPWNLFC